MPGTKPSEKPSIPRYIALFFLDIVALLVGVVA